MDLGMEAGPPPAGPINPYAAPETPADMASAVGIGVHDLTREEVEAFVGDNYKYYWGNWQRAVAGGLRAGFNWPAFFLNFAWLLYRKMYREFFIGIAAVIGLGIVQGVVESLTEKNLDALDKVENIVIAVTMGLLGNGLYLRKARREIGRARAQEADPERRAALLKARGGTSWIGLLVAIALGIGFGVLAAMAG
jgi:uncharacterized protein DUF2628